MKKTYDVHGFVRLSHMLGESIGVRVDSNSLDPHLGSCIKYATSNFTTIRDQDLLKLAISFYHIVVNHQSVRSKQLRRGRRRKHGEDG